MEDGLRERSQTFVVVIELVLILVLMEDGLREGGGFWLTFTAAPSLNPCFNGRWSASRSKYFGDFFLCCLNPCFNGRWSARMGSVCRLTVGAWS